MTPYSVLFTEDAEGYIDVSNIVCVLICYKYREDSLELEDDLILPLDVLHHTNEVVTVAEAAELVEMTETGNNDKHSWGSREQRKNFRDR